MSRDSYEVRRCDLCGHEADGRLEPDLSAWGRMAAVAKNTQTGKILAVGQDGQDTGDLCPVCATDLFDWLAGKPADIPQPLPTRTRWLDKTDRALIARVITKAMTKQIWACVAMLREQPSSLLQDQSDLTFCFEGMADEVADAAKKITDIANAKGVNENDQTGDRN